jgi:hypothetical protein
MQPVCANNPEAAARGALAGRYVPLKWLPRNGFDRHSISILRFGRKPRKRIRRSGFFWPERTQAGGLSSESVSSVGLMSREG